MSSWLGLVGYYRSFIPSLADISAPLFRLLKKDIQFKWTETEMIQWKKIQFCDASNHGVGVVLIQNEKIVGCSSRILNDSEQKFLFIQIINH